MDEIDAPEIGNSLPSRARARAIGRPKIDVDIRAVAQEYSEDVMRAMAEIALDPNEKAQSRVAAGQLVIGYAHGKPSEPTPESIGAKQQNNLDTSKLTPEELRTLLELSLKARVL